MAHSSSKFTVTTAAEGGMTTRSVLIVAGGLGAVAVAAQLYTLRRKWRRHLDLNNRTVYQPAKAPSTTCVSAAEEAPKRRRASTASALLSKKQELVAESVSDPKEYSDSTSDAPLLSLTSALLRSLSFGARKDSFNSTTIRRGNTLVSPRSDFVASASMASDSEPDDEDAVPFELPKSLHVVDLKSDLASGVASPVAADTDQRPDVSSFSAALPPSAATPRHMNHRRVVGTPEALLPTSPTASSSSSSATVTAAATSSAFLTTWVQRQFDPRWGGDVWATKLSHDAAMHGMQTTGLTFTAYLRMWALVGRQWLVNMIGNVLWHNLRGPKPQTREDLYLAAINTAICTYMDADGHLTFHDMYLPRCGKYGPLSTKRTDRSEELAHFETIRIELDHEAEICTRIVLNDRIVIDKPSEIATAMGLIMGTRAHPHVHWWANAIGETADVWPLAGKSMELTQYLNYLSVHGACDFMGLRRETMAYLIAANVANEGLPVHSTATQRVASKSKTHRMASLCRTALIKQLGRENMIKIESIIAATVMHSADHYYAGEYIQPTGECPAIGGNNLTMRLTIIAPLKFAFGKFLVRHHLNDAVCATLHRCCREVDATFADTALFIGPAS